MASGLQSEEDARAVASLVGHRGYQLLLGQFDSYLQNLQDQLLLQTEPLLVLRNVRQWQIVARMRDILRHEPVNVLDELKATGNIQYPEFTPNQQDDDN